MSTSVVWHEQCRCPFRPASAAARQYRRGTILQDVDGRRAIVACCTMKLRASNHKVHTHLYLTMLQYRSQSFPYFCLHAWLSLLSRCTACDGEQHVSTQQCSQLLSD